MMLIHHCSILHVLQEELGRGLLNIEHIHLNNNLKEKDGGTHSHAVKID